MDGFHAFFKLYKLYQIAKSITYSVLTVNFEELLAYLEPFVEATVSDSNKMTF